MRLRYFRRSEHYFSFANNDISRFSWPAVFVNPLAAGMRQTPGRTGARHFAV
jgi:hypothetical protein